MEHTKSWPLSSRGNHRLQLSTQRSLAEPTESMTLDVTGKWNTRMRSVLHVAHIEIVAESTLRYFMPLPYQRVFIGGSKVARGRGYEIEIFFITVLAETPM
ncbi:hypothetical protein TNCV_4598631 [Trichonephila clavipes]|nr:hypothetical protein TNCV_4598631 [Trichonephila clavipes]